MKTTIRKAYWNFEKEENWLNEMAAKGLALSDYSWCRYVFEDSLPGEYIYRIELLQYMASHPESIKYIRSMEESGAEHIASYMRWVYFRKKASSGAFDLFSDVESKIKHYSRVNSLLMTGALLNLASGIINTYLILTHILQGEDFLLLNFFVAILNIAIFIALFAVSCPIRKRVKKLKTEKSAAE